MISTIISKPLPKFDKEATIVLLDPQKLKAGQFSFREKNFSDTITKLYKSKQFNAQENQIVPVFVKDKLFLLVGIGNAPDTWLTALRMAVRKAILSDYLKNVKEVELIPHDQKEETIKAIVEGVLIGGYAWRKYITQPDNDKTVFAKTVYLITNQKNAVISTTKICEGVTLTRDLINDNADTVTSEYIEKTVRQLVKGKKNISLEILNKKELAKKGLNLHLAVNRASSKEPKLIIVKYNGLSSKKDYTALIGKGMTFDTGGLNLKPTGSIETMRCDMSGAAAVIGTLKNTISLNLKKNIIFAVSIAENAIGSLAYKPGDVFRSYSGKTVEIGNTDAEGRLVLADAISYVVKNYKPSRIIDIATLTGACVVALGNDYTGLVTMDDEFSRQLVHISNNTDDRIWRLPSYPELKRAVKSNIADIKNLGFPKGAGGTITAAEFLRQFTENTLWAHLDIAGTAFNDTIERLYYGYGATGAGVRLLTEYLCEV